jgi:hypothetical protein
MRTKLFRAALFASLFFRGCLLQPAHAQNPDLVLNPGSSYVDIGRGIDWGTQFNRTYVIVPNSPNASVCIYVVNNNPTNAHTFSVSTFQAADSQVANFSSNTGRFNSVPIVGMGASVPAGSMVSGFTQSTAAAKVAIKFTGAASQAGSPDSADVFLVQTTSGSCGSASSALIVQGTTAAGAAVIGNPLLIGGKDGSGLARFAQIGQYGNPGTALDGLAIGTGGVSPLATFSSVTTPGGTAGGALAVGLFAGANSASTLQLVESGSGSCTTNINCVGLYTATSGFARTFSQTLTATSALPLWTGSNSVGVLNQCGIYLTSAAGTGTVPTMDVYLQDSYDGTTFSDRIHLAQVTTSASKQIAGIAASAGITPQALQFEALAVSTKVDGPIGNYGQVDIKIGGTTPSFTFTVAVVCR